MWSPDGARAAYTSDTTGRNEVYVRPFPGPDEATLVSTNGGGSPAWNPNGRELFYIEQGALEDLMMTVSIDAAGHAGKPTPLFSFARGGLFLGTTVFTPYAVGQDGQKFFAVLQLPRTPMPVTRIELGLNWMDLLVAGHH
jgi:serine/threonine-protein kinase